MDGAFSNAKVFVNGHEAGGWPYGYASWSVNLTPWLQIGENKVDIALDNKPESSRWYPGGGIYRNVWLTATEKTAVAHWGSYVTTEAVGSVTIVQSTWSDYTIKLDGTELELSSATTPAGSSGVRVYQQAIAPGSHSVTRGNGESGLFYIEVKTGGDASRINNAQAAVLGHVYYNLQGMRIDQPSRGTYIRVKHTANGTKSSKVTVK